MSSLPRCEGTVVFGQLDIVLWLWVLPGLWLPGWPSASTASPTSWATTLGGAGSILCTMGPPTGPTLRPIHLPGTLQTPSSMRHSQLPALPCSLPCAPPSLLRSPTPSLPSLPPPIPLSPWDLAAPTNRSPAPLGLSAAHAVYSAGFGAVGQGQPWALVPAAWLTSAQPCSVWGAAPSCPSTSLSLWGISPAL